MGSNTVSRAEELLVGLQESLERDDYHLRVEDAAPGLRVVVSAGEDACADCLVPPAIFENIVGSMLKDGDLEVPAIEIVYPTDIPH